MKTETTDPTLEKWQADAIAVEYKNIFGRDLAPEVATRFATAAKQSMASWLLRRKDD